MNQILRSEMCKDPSDLSTYSIKKIPLSDILGMELIAKILFKQACIEKLYLDNLGVTFLWHMFFSNYIRPGQRPAKHLNVAREQF